MLCCVACKVITFVSADRYSIAFFTHPNDDVDISPLPSCVSPEENPSRPGISAGAYLQQKLNASY